MNQNKLALLGGDPVRTQKFNPRKTIGDREKQAMHRVLDKGDLSLFFGSPGEYFLGGPFVRNFEKKWAQKYGFKHCISTNSWTTGLMAAVGALKISPGDEVLCTPYTMAATATSILFYGGIPVFVDIDAETFNIDPHKLEEKITPRTRAIMLVHLFGNPADMDPIMAIARKHNLKVIEDGAQAPGAKYKGRYVGAIGDIGGFSLNYHKHIHSGEGGLLVTNDDDLALRCQLIRNHGENCIEAFNLRDLTNVIGANYRMTEIQAAIGDVQADYVEDYVGHRNELAQLLSRGLAETKCFAPPAIQANCIHSFYMYPFKYDPRVYEVPRSVMIRAILAEFPVADIFEQTPVVGGYVQPLYWNRIYQEKMALGRNHFPWSMNPQIRYDYSRGSCPVVEDMHLNTLMLTPLVREAITREDIKDLLRAIEKVIANVSELRTVQV